MPPDPSDEPGLPDSAPADETPIAVVRYGLAKEIQLLPNALAFLAREEGEVDRFALASIRTISLQPGERIPSKLLLLLELADGTTLIAAEGMTNVQAFRQLLMRLQEIAPQIVLDPPDMDEQLAQAVINRRQTNLGCYGTFLAAVLLIVLVFVIGNFILHHR